VGSYTEVKVKLGSEKMPNQFCHTCGCNYWGWQGSNLTACPNSG